VPVVFENAGLVMVLFPYTSISPGFGMSIDPADNVVPSYRAISPWLVSEVATETFPDPKRSNPPVSTVIEWTEIDDVEPSSPAPLAVVKVGMQTSLVGPGTLCVLQLEGLLHEPSCAFPVQSTLPFGQV
jgi:hypothetical protein